MHHHYTTKHLLLYLFNETEMTDSVLIQKKIDNDPLAEAEFKELKSSLRMFADFSAAPSLECLNRILKYSKDNSRTMHKAG